ncbi:beta strand repeat-containing protein [Acidicapsa dinghuensis]|uniref:Beta strand repeat-containing protein n=1 Tax=Acidicapsa dinghuensis TaxID=2218256 RepID=A0ABW1EI23_9BACT|nr:hypothetical protein [Acidicapsa dinghuensis]
MEALQTYQSNSFAARWPFLKLRSIPALLLSLFALITLSACDNGFHLPAATPDFSISVSPTTIALVANGSTQTISVTAIASNGFQQSVDASITGLPEGVTVQPASFTLAPGVAKNITFSASTTAASGTASVTFTANAGSISHSTTVAATISSATQPPSPDFALSVSPSSLSLTAGQSGSQVSVLATALNSFTGSVNVALSGLPAGVTASPSSLTLTPGAAQSITLTAASTAAASSTKITFTGTSGALTHSATITANISEPPPAPDFSLSASPTSLKLTAGQSGSQISVLANALNAFTGSVNVSISGLPSGVTASPSSLTLIPGTAQSITFTAASTATAGTATITFTGTSGALTHSTTVSLTVAAAPPAPDFSLSASPASLNLTAGQTGSSISVLATALNSFTGSVTVSFSGLPAGVTASPSSLTLTPGAAQNITFTAASTAAAGTAQIVLIGTSGTLTHTTALSLNVASAATPDFSFSLSPTSLSLTAGQSGSTIKLSATALNSFTGSIAVSVAGAPTGVTVTPAISTLTPGTPQSVTIAAGSTTTPGTYQLVFTATSGSLAHAATLNLTVAAAPNFAFSASPTSLSLAPGQTGTAIQFSSTAQNGFSSPVTVTFSGLPSGVTASPSSLTLTPGTPQSVTFTASSSATPGSSTITVTATSETLTHSTTLSLTVAPAPDFSLSASPTSLTITAGQSGSKVQLTASALNSFTGNVAVSITGLPSGVTASPSTLTLTPGVAQSTTLAAAGTAPASTATITFTGTSGTLRHSATVALTVVPVSTTSSGIDVTTYHYDNSRDGLNSQETTLTLANVNSTQFGEINFLSVDGRVDGEPLYLSQINAGGHTRNVLYVVTENDSVYAFDADIGAQIWQTSVIGANETTSDDRNCGQISPQIGITSTPVIDRNQGAHGTIFVVGMTKDSSGNYHHRIHALDLTTGAEIAGSPTEITASYPGIGDGSSNGYVVFAPSQYAERASLLLLNGTVYTTWTSHCDDPPYTGWIIGYSESTLQQTKLLNITPNGAEGSIWMSGGGPAADSSGNIYFLDANGTFDTTLNSNGFPSQGDYGNGILKISTSGSLAVTDYFEPYNTINESVNDTDFGSGGEILLPDQTDASGNTRHLIVGAGKDANIYVADRDNMGKFVNGANSNTYLYQFANGILATGVFSTPAFFNGTLYYGAAGDVLRAIPMTNARLASQSSSNSANTFAYPGATPSVSANGTQNGIVWALESGGNAAAVLHAFDASNLAHELYNSNQAADGRDSFGNGNKYITPMIVNGKVYVGTPTGVAVFGLLNP